MPQPTPGVSELDARLAEIDRGLQEIQSGLAPDVTAAPVTESPRPSPRQGPLAALLTRSRRRRGEFGGEEVSELVRMHNALLEAVGELVRMLGEGARAPVAESSPAPAALVSAGPFNDPRQVEMFVLTLAALEPVREATVLGYEGADRALIEVQLAEPSG